MAGEQAGSTLSHCDAVLDLCFVGTEILLKNQRLSLLSTALCWCLPGCQAASSSPLLARPLTCCRWTRWLAWRIMK